MKRQRRIIVTDAQDRQALEAIRSLDRAGFWVTGVASGPVAPGLWSRSCSSRRVAPAPAAGIEFIARLEALVRADRHDLVIAGTDESLYAISSNRERLAPYVELGLPTHSIVNRALDKRCLATEAEAIGFAGPEWLACERVEEALHAAERFGFPVLVKPVHTIAEQDGGLARYPSRLVSDEPALRRAVQEMGSSIVQRHERGNVISFCGIATDRGMLATVAARHIRIWPPAAGHATYSRTFILGDFSDRVGALLAALGWQGLFQLELIETGDGAIKPIDFNPRLYGSLPLASAAGAPLATLWCNWRLGENPTPVVASPEVSYRWEDGDARSILDLIRRREFRAAARATAPRRGVVHAYFQTRDPAPLLARALELTRGLWQHPRV